MENNRNPCRKNLKSIIFTRFRPPHFWLIGGLFLLAGLCYLSSLILPNWLSYYPGPSLLAELRQQERSIKSQFEVLRRQLHQRGINLVASLIAEKTNPARIIFSQKINSEWEGLAYLKDNHLVYWRGQVLPPFLWPPADGLSHVIRYKASVFLVIVFSLGEKEKLAVNHLLSFQPPLTTPFLRPYCFLRFRNGRNALIDFYSEEEDVSGFEKIFARHQDEYISQPRSKSDILTIFFPLRNEAGRIVATINLRSLNPTLRLNQQKTRWQFASCLCLFLAFLGLSLIGFNSWRKANYKSLSKLLIFLISLLAIRLICLRLESLINPKSSLFSPGLASLPIGRHFFSSPFDLFLTSTLIIIFFGCLIYDRRHWFLHKNAGKVTFFKKVLAFSLLISSLLPFYAFYKLSLYLILNSSLNLARLSPFWPTLFVILALSFFFWLLLIFIYLLITLARRLYSRSLSFWPMPLFFGLFLFGLLFKDEPLSIIKFIVWAAGAASIWFFICQPSFREKPYLRIVFLALAVIFFYTNLVSGLSVKEKALTEGYLCNAIISLEKWADYFLQESLPAIDQEEKLIRQNLQDKKPSNLALYLWKKTSLARWNWYSSLELSLPDGQVISRYSLNIPFFARQLLTFEPSDDWSLLKASLPLPGKEADFLIAYRDFRDDHHWLGRLTIYVLLNEEMLPFLYSAIPYFDLLRFPSVPSLKQFDFRLVVFRADGEIIFNPARLTAGISAFILDQLKKNPEGFLWTNYHDGKRHFRAYYFRHQQRIVAILWPALGFISLATGYLKFFFLWTCFIYFPLFLKEIISGRRVLASLFWAFSSRVYASFVAILLILLIPFSLLINSFINRLANERFSEKAAIQAQVARNIIEDFLFLQGEEETNFSVHELIHWVSTAINNDVNVYQDGVLIASSRQEFFDSGLLPDFLEGDIAYRLKEEKQPYVVWRKWLGSYSFQTLTIPLNINGSYLFITLSFPLEQEEIGRTQQELFEFLLFMVALSLIFIFLFARSIGSLVIKPIQKLLLATKEISSGNLDVYIEHRGHDEIQTLIDGFNRMVQDLKKHEKELAEMSKKAAWAEMARKIAHEIKNPLTPIRLSAEHLLRVYEEKPEEIGLALKESVSYIINEVENLRRLAQNFLAFSKETPLQLNLIQLNELLMETILPYKRLFSNRINFDLEIAEKLILLADREKLKIAFRNLLVNAIEAIKGKGEIKIKAMAKGQEIEVDIVDTGEGMDEATLNRIFEPDFSTKDLGTGLGLPIAKKIIEDHGGQITLTSSLGKGTKVKVTLPASQRSLNCFDK